MSKVIRVAFGASQPRLRTIEDCRAAAYDLHCKASDMDHDPSRVDEALRLYREAITLDPSLASAHVNLGTLLFRRGEPDEALRMYARAISIDPRQTEALYNVGVVAIGHGNVERAVHFFQRALESDPNCADAHFHLAMVFEEMGNVLHARVHWKKNLELEPAGEWAAIARAHL